MNKAELIESVQAQLGGESTKKDATEALAAVLDSISKGVKADGSVQIIGFGTFKISERGARTGRNPKTGEPMEIGASKTIRFSPSSNLKASL